jgi:hypothetical protein
VGETGNRCSLKERVRFALRHLMPPHRVVPAGLATAT